MLSDLQKSILHTLAFFAAQEMPLTLLELHNFLKREHPKQPPVGLFELKNSAEKELSSKVTFQDGLYTLRGYERLFNLRQRKYPHSIRLFKKAVRWANLLRFFPFVRSVAISGTLAHTNAGEKSDIDLFIITEPKRMFLARFLVSFYFQIFGIRRHGQKIAGRFCLNHYTVLGKSFYQDRNLYTAMLYTNFIPVFGARHLRGFWEANLPWIKEFFIAPRPSSAHIFEYAHTSSNWLQRFVEFVLNPLAEILERILGGYQKRRIQQSDTVLVSDEELSLHPGSKGQRILAEYRRIVSTLL